MTDVNVTDGELTEFYGFPYEYIPSIMAIIIILIYSLAVRLAYSFDYRRLHQGKLAVLENELMEIDLTKAHLYLVIIDTGFWNKAGTKAHVRLEIHATNFCSRVYCLRTANEGKVLQRGERDIFVLNTKESLGDILSVTLVVISPGQMTTWFLERIKIVDVKCNRKWIFPCYRWLTNNDIPHFIVKLFPQPTYVPQRKQFFQSRTIEINIWLSIFISYNRLGRLSRIERITICANMLMSIIFAYVALVQSEYWYLLDGESSSEKFLFVLLCFTIVLLVILLNYLPEMILRNSIPNFGKRDELIEKMGEEQCVACNKKSLAADSAVMLNELGHNPNCSAATCKICLQNNQANGTKVENEGEIDQQMCKFGKTPEELIDKIMNNDSKKKIRINDVSLSIRYYDSAANCIKFFNKWSALCDKFCDVLDELRGYMDIYRECELMRRRKCLIWLLGAMEELQEQFCIVRRNFKNDSCMNYPAPPESILYPDACFNPDSDEKMQDSIRLTRLCIFLMVITIVEGSDRIKNDETKTVYNVPPELKAQLHHLVFCLFCALDAFVIERSLLYEVDGKVLKNEVKSIDDFIRIYICDPENCDFELVAGKNDSEGKNDDEDKEEEKEEEEENVVGRCGCNDVSNNSLNSVTKNNVTKKKSVSWKKKSVSEYPLQDIRTQISDQTNRIVNEITCKMVQVFCARQPLSNFVDYMRYRIDQNEPLEWASVCVDFTLPLIAVLCRPLISGVQRFTLQKWVEGFVCAQIRQYIQTVIINAALELLKAVKRECQNGSRDPFQDTTSIEMCFTDNIETCSEYSIAVNRFRHYLEYNNIVNQIPNKQCPEGKVHIDDTNVLKLLLEENKLKPNQLACGQMVDSMKKLIATYYSKLVAIDKFVSQALLMLTDSQELLLPSHDCASITSLCSSIDLNLDESREVILKTRQQIQQMNLVLPKLIRISKESAPKDQGKEPVGNIPTFWTSSGYVNQPFIKTVESFKHEIMSDEHPFTNKEVLRIQEFAFNIHKMHFSFYWTLAVYICFALQNIVFLALIFHWVPRVSRVAGLATIPVLIIGLFVEIVVAQPLKLVIMCFLARKYAEKKNKKEETPKS